MPETRRITEICVGERFRRDMGDIEALAKDIETRGLLQPIGVTPGNELIYGHRRLLAIHLLGLEEIAVTVHDIEDILGAEHAENTQRKDFAPTEAVAIGREIEKRHREKIEAQETARKVGNPRTTKSKQLGREPVGQTRNAAARAVGMGVTKYDKAKAVVAAAEAEPEKFGDLPERMDETGNVSGTHRELERRKAGPVKRKPRHAVHGRSHYRKPNREIERALISLDGICDLLDTIPTEEVDASKSGEWSESLKRLAARLNRFARKING